MVRSVRRQNNGPNYSQILETVTRLSNGRLSSPFDSVQDDLYDCRRKRDTIVRCGATHSEGTPLQGAVPKHGIWSTFASRRGGARPRRSRKSVRRKAAPYARMNRSAEVAAGLDSVMQKCDLPPRQRFKQPYAFGCQTFQTLPTKSGPGFKVGSPGSHPAGQASAPFVFRTCWKACT